MKRTLKQLVFSIAFDFTIFTLSVTFWFYLRVHNEILYQAENITKDQQIQ